MTTTTHAHPDIDAHPAGEMVEIRCPSEDCGKLVLRYLRHQSQATLDLKCPRCKTPWTFELRST